MGDCGKHGWKHNYNKLLWRILLGVVISVGIIIVIIVIAWAALRPTKPEFTIQDATLYAFNVSTNPSLLTSTIQLTLTSQNPNDNTGIYYDHLSVYATYRDQQITPPYSIPPVYQSQGEVNVWSPFIFGNLVPVAPYNAVALAQDRNSGVVDLTVRVNGQIRFKVGSIIYGRNHLAVRCPVQITFGSRFTGVLVGDAIKYDQIVQSCTVSV